MEMRKSIFSSVVEPLCRYKIFRKLLLGMLTQLEGGEIYSLIRRQIMAAHYGIKIGDYSYGEAMKPGAWPPGIEIGRYVSIGPGVKVFLRNHPLERISMHPFFYNQCLGYVEMDNIKRGTLQIGHDVWVGGHAVILPGCRKIGIGAVIGAGDVATKNVPRFAMLGGNPARIIRYRFDEKDQKKILASRWWEKSIGELVQDIKVMTFSFKDIPDSHPILQQKIL